jgi:hypothetical protein
MKLIALPNENLEGESRSFICSRFIGNNLHRAAHKRRGPVFSTFHDPNVLNRERETTRHQLIKGPERSLRRLRLSSRGAAVKHYYSFFIRSGTIRRRQRLFAVRQLGWSSRRSRARDVVLIGSFQELIRLND